MHFPPITRRDCLALLGLPACGGIAAAATAAGTPPALQDHMPAFWQAYDAHPDGPPDARAQALVQAFFAPRAADYRRAGVPATPDRVARWLPTFDAMAADVRDVHRRFGDGYARHLAGFRAALPDFDGQASPVALLPSLLHFDAHLQPDGAQLPLFFGPDGIVRFHGAGADLGVLFAHELFHCYQAQMNPSMCLAEHPPVYAGLWIEGTATYASERLQPGASLLHVLLDAPELLAMDAAAVRTVARALLAHLDRTDDAAQALFFDAGTHGDWPPRAGYLVGLHCARRVGEALALPAMARLPAPRVREALASALRSFG